MTEFGRVGVVRTSRFLQRRTERKARARTGEKQVPRLARNDNFFQKLSKKGKGNGNSTGYDNCTGGGNGSGNSTGYDNCTGGGN
jgi:hypothetical protein